MESNTEFRKIGKQLPYKAPKGFFEEVSETTLRKAKQRVLERKKTLNLWRTMAIAASLTGIALIGYNLFDNVKPNIAIAEVENMKDSVGSNQEMKKIEEAKVEIVALKKIQSVPENSSVIEVPEEKLSDILAELSDEELQQIAALYRTDPFMEGIQQ